MAVFHVDLDNTLIYSHKRDIGREKRCVEIYQGREVSFITDRTYRLLQKVKERALVVPTTTRTEEQYGRISLGIGELECALVCNGGVLLVDGKKDEEWYAQSLGLVKGCGAELRKAIGLLEKEPGREMEVRFIERLFVFTKCRDPQPVVQSLQKALDPGSVDVQSNGRKIYVVPKELSKGMAVERFRGYKRSGPVCAAGDSVFDVSMMAAADIAAAPKSLLERFCLPGHVSAMPGQDVYAEEVLRYILKML